MLTDQAVKEFMLSRTGMSPATQQWYRWQLRHFEGSFPHLPTTPQPIQRWLAGLQGVAPETVHGAFRAVRALYNQVKIWHPKTANPMPLVRSPRLHKKAMRTFSELELFGLFLRPLSPRNRALLTLLLDTGLRARECANLTWEDVATEALIVNGKTGERWVPISEATYSLLCALRAEANASACGGEEHVFQGKRGALSYEGIYKTVRKQLAEAGISGKRCSPHTFRHTFGTSYASSDGCDPQVLQMIMGHSDFKTTLRYIHSSRRRMAENHQQCSPLRALGAVAQGSFFTTNTAVKEAEEIVAAHSKSD